MGRKRSLSTENGLNRSLKQFKVFCTSNGEEAEDKQNSCA